MLFTHFRLVHRSIVHNQRTTPKSKTCALLANTMNTQTQAHTTSAKTDALDSYFVSKYENNHHPFKREVRSKKKTNNNEIFVIYSHFIHS